MSGASIEGVQWTATVRSVLVVGALLGASLCALWGLLLYTRTPEPVTFLALVRAPERGGARIEDCIDCPAFLLLDRGFMSPHDPLGSTLGLASLPAVYAAVRRDKRSMIPELNPARFVAGLLAQGIVVAALLRGALLRVRNRGTRIGAKKRAAEQPHAADGRGAGQKNRPARS